MFRRMILPGSITLYLLCTLSACKDTSALMEITTTSPSAPRRMAISPDTSKLYIGDSTVLQASFVDAAGNQTESALVTWTVSDTAVARISPGGTLKAVQTGVATVTAQLNDASKTAQVWVVPRDSASASKTDSGSSTAMLPASCQARKFARLVRVSSGDMLTDAILNARPGDLIVLDDATYRFAYSDGQLGQFVISISGTQAQRITMCGSPQAVIYGGSLTGYDGIKLNASYWTLAGFTITHALRAIITVGANHDSISGLTIHGIGQEAVAIQAFSSFNTIENNHIYDTGIAVPVWGEGIYIGTPPEYWCTYTACQPDKSDSNFVIGNTIGPDVRAEHIDVKAGTTGGSIINNTFDGTGMILQPNDVNSWVVIAGVGYTIDGNHGVNALLYGFKVEIPGANNIFSKNVVDVRGSGYGFRIAPETTGNILRCDNVVLNAQSGFANVRCQ